MNYSNEYRSKVVALILLVFLGSFGAHQFYLGNKKIGITQLVLSLVGYATIIILIGVLPIMVVSIWLIVDLVRILISDESDFGWSM